MFRQATAPGLVTTAVEAGRRSARRPRQTMRKVAPTHELTAAPMAARFVSYPEIAGQIDAAVDLVFGTEKRSALGVSEITDEHTLASPVDPVPEFSDSQRADVDDEPNKEWPDGAGTARA